MEYVKKNYPKAIYKDGEVKVVHTPFEHASLWEDGWSGPPEFNEKTPDLEGEIKAKEQELVEMKKRLAQVKAAEKAKDKATK
jgi:hypothetical protein